MRLKTQLLAALALQGPVSIAGQVQIIGNALTATIPLEIPENEPSVCNVCGDGGAIQNLYRMVVTSFGMFSCGGLAGAGAHGNIPSEHCNSAQTAAIENCGCMLEDGTILNEERPLGCSICADGGIVTIPEGLIALPGQTERRKCSDFANFAVNSMLSPDQCEDLQTYANETCGCMDPKEVEQISHPRGDSDETFVCDICGTGMTSSKPDTVVVLPSRSDRTCREFEEAAASGKIAPQQCELLRQFVEQSCQCVVGSPSAVPQALPSDAYDCPICGEGMVVSDANGIVTIPTQEDRTCAQLLSANERGRINERQCMLLQPFVKVPCACTPIGNMKPPSPMPTTAVPTIPMEPTVSPAPTGWQIQKEGCFDNLMEIYEIERIFEDVSMRRRYILCPGTTYELGEVSEDGRIVNGDAFLMLRPNVMYQCGKDGSRQNNCILKGGDFGLVSFYGIYEGIYEAVDNVKVIGLTFQSQTIFGAVLESAGDVEFVDCVFENHKNMAPILIQWKGDGPESAGVVASSRDRRLRSAAKFSVVREFKNILTGVDHPHRSRRLQFKGDTDVGHSVTFHNCIFRGNFISGELGFPGIIENTHESELNIRGCIFEDNHYGPEGNPAPYGFAIRSFGSINLESSCFLDNTFLKHGPVQIYGAPHTNVDNFVRSHQTDMNCDFMAVFSTKDDTTDVAPVCFEADSDRCMVDRGPTPAPTRGPPTRRPVAAPATTTPMTTEERSATPPRSSASEAFVVGLRTVYMTVLASTCLVLASSL